MSMVEITKYDELNRFSLDVTRNFVRTTRIVLRFLLKFIVERKRDVVPRRLVCTIEI